MSYVKVDEDLVSTTQGKVETASGNASNLTGLVEQLSSDAIEELDRKLKEYKSNNPEPTQAPGMPTADFNAQHSAWQKRISGVEERVEKTKEYVGEKKGTALDAIAKIVERLGNVSSGLGDVISAITTFNSEVNMEEAFEQAGIQVGSIGTGTNANSGENIPVMTYSVDGQEYTLAELLNAFYTYTGMSMSTVVAGAIVAEELGIDPAEYAEGAKGDAIRKKMLEQVGALTGFAAQTRLYGLATEEDQNQFAKAVGIDDLSQYTSARSLLNEDNDSKYGDLIGGGLGGFSTNFGKVAGSVMGAFGLASFLNKHAEPNEIEPEPETETEDTGSTDQGSSDTGNSYTGGPGGSYGGGTSGSSSGSPSGKSSDGDDKKSGSGKEKTPTPTDPSQDDPVDPTIPPSSTDPTATLPTTPTVTETPAETPGAVSPTEGNTEPLATPEDASELPTADLPSIPDGIEKDYDDLARQQFEAQGEDKISEHRAEIIEKANKLFEAEDKTPLKEELRKYGYNETDIETIIQDRDLTVSAMVSGDQREQLTKIAQELANKDGIKEFDTVYDNEQTAASLTDGTTTKLLANMSSDEGIKNAYTALTNAETSYTEANTAAVAAMASVTTARNKLAEITKNIGTDIKTNPYQWDSKTMTAYNTEVTKLHDETVKTIGGNINNWSAEDIKKYQEAEAKYTTEVAYKRGTDMATWTTEQKTSYEKNLADLKAKYVKAYGKDTSKWSSEAKQKYETAKTNTYKQMAVQVGKGNLTEADKKAIDKKVQTTKDEIIAKNGDYKNWTAEQKKAYEEKVADIQKKYGDKTSTATGEATWTKEQAKEYNDAVAEYNAAVAAAKEAVTKLETAKTDYNQAKTDLNTAKENFFNNLVSSNAPVEQAPEVPVVDPAAAQTNSGNPGIGGIEISESGATIGTGGTTVLDENGVVQQPVQDTAQPATPEAVNNVQPEIIVNDDEAAGGTETKDYGIPIVDIGSNTSGTISNDDIRI